MTWIADPATEMALLGSMLLDAETTAPALRSVPREAWSNPRHSQLAALMLDMHTRGQGVDKQTVVGQIAAQGMMSTVDPAYVAKLGDGSYFPFHSRDYAERVIELYGQRQLAEITTRTQQRLTEGWERGDGIDVATAVAELRTACDAAQTTAGSAQASPLSLAELLETEDSYNWLVPGLLERAERLVLTGGEGAGKSELVSQFAATLCAGLHPFTGRPLGDGDRGLRVLVVDAENSERQTRRRYRRIVRCVDQARADHGLGPADWRGQFFVHCRPEGLDLTSGRDITWLEHAVSAVAPDVLVLGPLYKLHAGDPSDEQLAHQLVSQIDSIRARHDCALITEAHAGHAQDGGGNRKMRPSGSSLWLRWPEFGYGLRRSQDEPPGGFSDEERRRNRERPVMVDVVAWRGSREERQWPTALVHGTTLPWVPADPDYGTDF
ncbi:AAA family ATPase [Actinopolyspora halophila]|uniref:AAA family ATPase n=1 Tax=Actinopolyspora halophila TaxID=1850 RepID=UPI0003781A9E|nr:AAA family ATPase [Actinopolyspora halophila]